MYGGSKSAVLRIRLTGSPTTNISKQHAANLTFFPKSKGLLSGCRSSHFKKAISLLNFLLYEPTMLSLIHLDENW